MLPSIGTMILLEIMAMLANETGSVYKKAVTLRTQLRGELKKGKIYCTAMMKCRIDVSRRHNCLLGGIINLSPPMFFSHLLQLCELHFDQF